MCCTGGQRCAVLVGKGGLRGVIVAAHRFGGVKQLLLVDEPLLWGFEPAVLDLHANTPMV